MAILSALWAVCWFAALGWFVLLLSRVLSVCGLALRRHVDGQEGVIRDGCE